MSGVGRETYINNSQSRWTPILPFQPEFVDIETFNDLTDVGLDIEDAAK